jgi:hypothetical protein
MKIDTNDLPPATVIDGMLTFSIAPLYPAGPCGPYLTSGSDGGVPLLEIIRPYAARKRQTSQSTEEVRSRPVGGGNRRSPGGNRGLPHNHR